MPSPPLLARLRRLCRSFPEVVETAAFGHPNFVAGSRTFVAWETVGGRPSIAFRQSPADVALLLGQPGFFETPYGRGVWVSLRADGRVSWPRVVELTERAYRLVALKRMITMLDGGPRPGAGGRGRPR